MQPIKDFDIYITRMRKSMYDKLWFIDKLPDDIKCLYDYGCGDGTLCAIAKDFLPNIVTIGYDMDKRMREQAEHNADIILDNPLIIPAPAETCLVASSVFHEIHSYSDDIKQEYANIFNVGADYIAIRDMFYENGVHILPQHIQAVRDNANQRQLKEFEDVWGSINKNNKNFIHFLLKYRYVENWDRELHENYLFSDYQGFLDNIPNNYEVVYQKNYTLPFIKEQVYKDFGIPFIPTTHAKILLKRVK